MAFFTGIYETDTSTKRSNEGENTTHRILYRFKTYPYISCVITSIGAGIYFLWLLTRFIWNVFYHIFDITVKDGTDPIQSKYFHVLIFTEPI